MGVRRKGGLTHGNIRDRSATSWDIVPERLSLLSLDVFSFGRRAAEASRVATGGNLFVDVTAIPSYLLCDRRT